MSQSPSTTTASKRQIRDQTEQQQSSRKIDTTNASNIIQELTKYWIMPKKVREQHSDFDGIPGIRQEMVAAETLAPRSIFVHRRFVKRQLETIRSPQ
jgi:hypothetical protein